MMPRSLRWLITSVFTAAGLLAQTAENAAIRGQVLDSSGASVPSAGVKLENTATGIRRDTQTDLHGYFTLADLPLTGEYHIEVVKNGFATKGIEHIRLRAGESAILNFTMAPQFGRSEVAVFGTIEGIRSDSPQLGTRLDKTTLQETPISGRKLTTLPLLDSAIMPARGTGDCSLEERCSSSTPGAAARPRTCWMAPLPMMRGADRASSVLSR